MMFLLNAVYFRANWMQQVDSEGEIEQGYFVTSSGSRKPAQFFRGMLRERRFHNGSAVRVLAVPFGRWAASIYFFMPRNSDGSVDDMIAEMAENGIGQYSTESTMRTEITANSCFRASDSNTGSRLRMTFTGWG